MSLRHITHFPFKAKKVVLINLQATPDDEKADLRIWAKCDPVFAGLMQRLGVEVDPTPVWRPRDSVSFWRIPRWVDIRDVEAAKRLEVVAKQREAEARERSKQAKIEKRKAKKEKGKGKEKEKEKEREGDRMVVDLTGDEDDEGMIDLTLDEKGGEDAEQRVCPSSSFWPSWLRL